METEGQPIKLLVMAGGLSTRMGSPKFLLPHADGRPSYLHTLQTLHSACKFATAGFVTLRNPAAYPGEDIQSLPGLPIEALYESDLVGVSPRLPLMFFRGLLRAFQQDPIARWLVMPCDYPLMSVAEIENLLLHYQDPVTCLENGRGKLEPLVAVWGPTALAHLAERARAGDVSMDLRVVFEALGGTKVRPKYDHSFFNTNDREDWDDAIRLLASGDDGHVVDGTQQTNSTETSGPPRHI